MVSRCLHHQWRCHCNTLSHDATLYTVGNDTASISLPFQFRAWNQGHRNSKFRRNHFTSISHSTTSKKVLMRTLWGIAKVPELQKFRIIEIRIIEVFVGRFSRDLNVLFELATARITRVRIRQSWLNFNLDRIVTLLYCQCYSSFSIFLEKNSFHFSSYFLLLYLFLDLLFSFSRYTSLWFLLSS